MAAYLRSDIALRDFADWILSAAWKVDEKEDAATAKLLYEIELRLFEASNGDWTEDELRQLLRPMVILETGTPRAFLTPGMPGQPTRNITLAPANQRFLIGPQLAFG